jgi:hypothetical protein
VRALGRRRRRAGLPTSTRHLASHPHSRGAKARRLAGDG